MFSKAPRFQPAPVSETPGPNAYNPTEPQANWKQGVFPNRPATSSRKPLTESENTISVRRPLAPSAKSNLGAGGTTAVTSASAKSQAKLEDRLGKAENRIQDLQREKTQAQNELGDLQTELRLAAQREAKLKQSLEKWERSHSSLKEKSSKLGGLQARLDELTRVHEESKARRQREVEELSERLRTEERHRRSDLAEARKLYEAEKAKADLNERRHGEALAQLADLQKQESGSQDQIREKELLLQKLQEEEESIKVALIDAQMYACRVETQLKAQVEQLQGELDARRARLETESKNQTHQVHAARMEMLEEVEELNTQLVELETQHRHNLGVITGAFSAMRSEAALQLEEQRVAGLGSAQERRSLEALARAQLQEISALTEARQLAQEERDTALGLIDAMQYDLETIVDELRTERAFACDCLEDGNSITSANGERCSGRTEYSIDENVLSWELGQLKSELEQARQRADVLEEELEGLHVRLLAAARDSKETAAALITANAQISTLEATVSSKQRELDLAVAQLAGMSELRVKLQKASDEMANAKKEAKAQSEAARSMSTSLQNARVAEQALREECDGMAAMLDSASRFEALYHELAQQTRHLVERNALAEEEKATLSALNSELLGHTNPNQKIQYMDRVRRELDEVKEDNIHLRVQLEQLVADNEQLTRELRIYKAVDVPLHERPRAMVTRVVRANDHQALLRSVSSTLESTQQQQQQQQQPVAQHQQPPHTTQQCQVHSQKEVDQVAGSRMPVRTVSAPRIPDAAQAKTQVATASRPPPLKKRRSYGRISVHVPEEEAESAESHAEVVSKGVQQYPNLETEQDDADSEEDGDITSRPTVIRNKPRATLVNSGALRATSNPIKPVAELAVEDRGAKTARTMSKPASRPSLGVSSLGVKARRVSELVRASSPPLPMISDASVETPNLLSGALPSPSPNLADWTMDAPTVPIPRMPHGGYGVVHSTPLPISNVEMSRPRPRKSRYSGALRIQVPALPASATPGLLPGTKPRASLVIREENGNESTVYEDDHDQSWRLGWQDDLPEFTIDGVASNQPVRTRTNLGQTGPKAAPTRPAAHTNKKLKPKSSGKPSTKALKPKPGPMARTIFR
ncbi:hypothetical protein BCV70DRAFT_198443 [Testicularia cyperi]|uniref:Hyaluronan-mediated motility receptor C-terminal domain-containing protein n=1 Tax=Testicularia cyperi TaxID=1882483 RepID=A0A317XW70_9BASI|nr:hypothetical protein BCV70DRAFT_198443 [Testicularia cyperi]